MIELKAEYTRFHEDIEAFNESLQFLKGQFVAQLPLNRDEAATTSANCAFIFDWVRRGYLSRTLNLAENYSTLLNNKEALASALLGRALLETIAQFHHLLREVERNLNSHKYAQVYFLLGRFMLGGDHKFASERKKLKKIHVNDGLRELDKTYNHTSDTYNWLSEFCHPNSLGVVLMFSRMNRQDQILRLLSVPFVDENSSPAFEASIYFPIFHEDWIRSNDVHGQIEREWKFTEEVFDIFE
jgi:hypothetical protein